MSDTKENKFIHKLTQEDILSIYPMKEDKNEFFCLELYSYIPIFYKDKINKLTYQENLDLLHKVQKLICEYLESYQNISHYL